mgnify:FL=1
MELCVFLCVFRVPWRPPKIRFRRNAKEVMIEFPSFFQFFYMCVCVCVCRDLASSSSPFTSSSSSSSVCLFSFLSFLSFLSFFFYLSFLYAHVFFMLCSLFFWLHKNPNSHTFCNAFLLLFSSSLLASRFSLLVSQAKHISLTLVFGRLCRLRLT